MVGTNGAFMDIAHETLSFDLEVAAPRERVWAAFADPTRRVEWSVPDGEAQVFDHDDLRSGGTTRYRCGEPGVLPFHGSQDHLLVVPGERVVQTDVVETDGQVLAAALITWTFTDTGAGTRIDVLDQVTSFVGEGMIDGHRAGHRLALEQLARHLAT